ncbi:hypothetical protein NEISICOT_01485 [Neisseria sicca ATCC 29256]|uniref:Uncharacterized protein n=1 Tax=Neisseria sicca ATCC 29256 TaxID=547045 RepID=C6M4N8_NEISI|nr:hypothetical protein NEISICOT_01485 [Neisseria sicca ATCC 29256]
MSSKQNTGFKHPRSSENEFSDDLEGLCCISCPLRSRFCKSAIFILNTRYNTNLVFKPIRDSVFRRPLR